MSRLSTPRDVSSLAPTLPINNSIFQRAGFVLRRGQFSILAAAPGVGKTILATNLAILSPKIPTLYLSADSDEWTVRTRACSILTGHTLVEVERNSGQESWDQHYNDRLRKADHVDFCYRSDLDPEFIVYRMQAYLELQGAPPHLLIVDNLGNAVVDQDKEAVEMRAMCRDLQALARSTGAHVMTTHHVTGPKESGTQQIGLSDLLWKIGKIPEVVIGVNRNHDTELNMFIAKNRGGKANVSIPVPIDYTRATIGGFIRS